MEAEGTRGRGGKLVNGVRLALLYPEWNRPCETCEKYIWKRNDPGRVERTAAGEPVRRALPTIPLRCAECPKVPQWAKEAGKTWQELRALAVEGFTDENRKAFDFYKGCRAVGHFPDDPLVRWYADLIRGVYDDADRRPVDRQTTATTALITLLMNRFKGRI